MSEGFEAREARYRKFKEKNPQASFAQYLMRRQLRTLGNGNTTGALSVALGEREEFWSAGESKAKKLMSAMTLAPHHKAIEYGCGSLRVGAHFIRALATDGFFGLDVIDGFYEIGKAMIGAELLAAKAPRFGIIGEPALAEAAQFAADFVYSNVVCVHVHPDEVDAYFHDLARLTHKRGARLVFNAALFERPVRYAFDGWAWPLEFYRQSLAGLDCVRTDLGRSQNRNGHEITPVELEFRR
ncbi:MAG TPA: hypothetical protein VHZ29_18920 [Rhizomicrobium sp.]|jgi:hypothetical protein|nr:hypothetical protein [Rhizomicrobium sp.]